MSDRKTIEELAGNIPIAGESERECSSYELTLRIHAFFDTLEQRSRVMFIRRYCFYDPASKIAWQFKTAPKNVESELSRLRDQLREFLIKENIFLNADRKNELLAEALSNLSEQYREEALHYKAAVPEKDSTEKVEKNKHEKKTGLIIAACFFVVAAALGIFLFYQMNKETTIHFSFKEYEDAKSMLQDARYVFVGTVESISYELMDSDLDELVEKRDVTGEIPYTIYDIRIEEVLIGSFLSESTVVIQPGGEVDGKKVILKDAAVIEEGETYLFVTNTEVRFLGLLNQTQAIWNLNDDNISFDFDTYEPLDERSAFLMDLLIELLINYDPVYDGEIDSESSIPEMAEIPAEGFGSFYVDYNVAPEASDKPYEPLIFAESEEDEDEIVDEQTYNYAFRYFAYDDHIEITQYVGIKGEAVIPETIDGLPVTVIRDGTFSGDVCMMEEVTVPDTVTYISSNAFKQEWLDKQDEEFLIIGDGILIKYGGTDTSVIVPEGVKKIYGAFNGCDFIEEIILPENLEIIGDYAFYQCTSLKEITIPKKVTEIGFDAFAYCNSLSDIVNLEQVEKIGENAFYKCASLKSVVFSDNLTAIGTWAFSSCTSLESVTFGNQLKSIGDRAFCDCYNLNYLTFPDSLTEIGEEAFLRCVALTTIYNGKNVCNIGFDAFMSTPWLEYQESDFIVAGDYVLLKCRNIEGETLKLPQNIKYIAGNAFVEDSVFYSDYYLGEAGTLLTNIVLPEGLLGRGEDAFYGCSSLKEITLPESLKEICEGAFWGCSSLTNIVIPKNVEYLRRNAFSNCTGLSEIVIEGNLKVMEGQIFDFCHSLEKVTISGSCDKIGDNAFIDSMGLKEIFITGDIKEIGKSAFEHCTSLEKIVLPESIEIIGEYAFYECPLLTIYGKEGSVAETYALENDIPFVAE